MKNFVKRVVFMKKSEYSYREVKKFGSVAEMVSLAEQEAGDKIAYKFRENGEIRSVTYKEFRKTTLSIGTALMDMGVLDKHIAMLGENSYNWICVYLSVLQGNGVFVPIDKELAAEPMCHVLNESDSEVLFYTKRFSGFVKENRDKFPKVKTFIAIDEEEDAEEALSYKKLIERGRAIYDGGNHAFKSIEKDVRDMRMLVYTSGTTGVAKGVMLSEYNLVSSVYYGMQVSSIFGTGLSVLPYNHTYEAIPGILVAIHFHVTLCINENLKTVLKNLTVYKPDYIYLVPAFVEVFYRKVWSTARAQGKEKGLKMLIKISNALRKIGIDKRRTLFKSVHEAFGGNLKKIVCGGAPLRQELGEFFDAIGISLTNGYGITECSPLVSVNHDTYNDCTTVGLPLPCCEIKLEDVDEDGNGEICVKGDVVMMGYYKKPDITAEVLSEDGWFRTGDYGRMNDMGRLIISGRKKNIIILENGKNIFPEEIEEYILLIPYVEEAIVYGVKNKEGIEESLSCQVFLSKDKLSEMEISDGAARVKADIAEALRPLPVYKHVKNVIVRDEAFEKTTSNKIKRDKIDKTI